MEGRSDKPRKKSFEKIRDFLIPLSRERQGGKTSLPESEVKYMKVEAKSRSPGCDRELIDVLIAISVVARVLACKLEKMEEK